MSDSQAILAGVTSVARKHLDWQAPLGSEMRLVEDLELDSLRLLTLAMEVENYFRICLDSEDEAGIETVGDLIETIGRKLDDAKHAADDSQ